MLRLTTDVERPIKTSKFCSFGITEAIAAVGASIASGVSGFAAGDLGLGAGLSSALGAGAETGIGLGLGNAGLAALTGGKPLKAGLEGLAAGVGAGALGPVLGSTLGIGAAGGEALGGALGGGLEQAATGNNFLSGALSGGIGGLGANLSGLAPGEGALGASAPAGAAIGQAPASLGGSNLAIPDLTSAVTPENPGLLPGGGGGGTPGIGGAATGGSSLVSPTGLDTSIASLSQAGGLSTAGAGASASTPTSLENFFSNPSAGSAYDVLKANPGAALDAAGLGYQLINGNQTSSAQKALESQASTLAGQGTQLQSYLQTGTLPPGAQQAVTQATNSAKAAIKSKYASLGLSGSTMETQELNNVDTNAASQVFSIADQLLTAGLSESQLSSQLYESLMSATNTQNQQLSQAIANFAAASAGGGSTQGITLKLANT